MNVNELLETHHPICTDFPAKSPEPVFFRKKEKLSCTLLMFYTHKFARVMCVWYIVFFKNRKFIYCTYVIYCISTSWQHQLKRWWTMFQHWCFYRLMLKQMMTSSSMSISNWCWRLVKVNNTCYSIMGNEASPHWRKPSNAAELIFK